jgi:hypothetical protein
MLFTSLSLIVLILAVPAGWVTIAAVVGACIGAKRYKNRSNMRAAFDALTVRRFASESLVLAVIPLALVSLGLLFWRDWQTAPPHPHQSLLLGILVGLCVLQIAALSWFIWRHCGRLTATTVVSVLAALWTLGAQFASSMAITGTWL